MANPGSATFFSELRRGAALGITRVDQAAAPPEPRALLDVHVNYDSNHDAATQLPLVGPGDIVGLDTRTIVRTFPKPDDNDAESDFLAYVELDQADLLWRYTPAKHQGAIPLKTDRLRPWLTLIVLEEGTEFSDSDLAPPTGTAKLPLLTINDVSLLTILTDAWAWGHVHVQGDVTEAQLPGLLAGRPGTVVARLMSPRRLEKQKAYRAFLVPTFRRGAIAGRGDDPGTTDALEPAWPFAAGEPNTLPVYHSWRFQTGAVSSFDEAARQLQPLAVLPPSVGQRDVDVSSPGFDLINPIGGTGLMPLLGALRKPPVTGESEAPILQPFIDQLAGFIDLGSKAYPDPSGIPNQVRIVVPPLYGRWYAAEDHLDQTSTPTNTNPPWFARLNRDPRHRIAAALGTDVVQRDQQSLMASAWEQGARLDVVNRALRVMQTGREVFTRLLVRHLGSGTQKSILTVCTPVLGRVFDCAPGPGPRRTLGGVLGGSPFGRGLRPPWRRIFRGDGGGVIDTINGGGLFPVPETPGGTNTPPTTFPDVVPGRLPDPEITKVLTTMSSDQRLYWGVVIFWVARKLLISDGGKFWWLLRKLLRLGLDLITLASTRGATQIGLAQKFRAGDLAGAVAGAPPAPGFTVSERDPDLTNPSTWPPPRALPTGSGGVDSAQAAQFRAAVADLMGYIGAPTTGRVFNKVNIPSLVSCVLTSLSPAVTFADAAKNRFGRRTLAWKNTDELEPIQLAPRIERATWEPLRDLSPEWILPGVGDVPRNTVSLLSTNQRFIESYMVGLNHEMTRELSWNGYAIDQRGSYFHQFWDSRGWVKGTDLEDDRPPGAFDDIVPPVGWGRTTELGDLTHSGRPSTDQLVLLVRGDLIKRFPNVIVYAVKAQDLDQDGNLSLPDDAPQSHPVFQSVLTGDVAYYGFELTREQVRGTGTGNDLGWFFILQEHPSEPKFRFKKQLAGARIIAVPADYGDSPTNVMAAAAVAFAASETPLRVAIHGKDLVPA